MNITSAIGIPIALFILGLSALNYLNHGKFLPYISRSLEILETQKAESMKFKVKNFNYNGFMGEDLHGFAKYSARFIKWTRDPGVAEFKCSDNKIRLIPTFALVGDISQLPKQDYEKLRGKTLFGSPTNSYS